MRLMPAHPPERPEQTDVTGHTTPLLDPNPPEGTSGAPFGAR